MKYIIVNKNDEPLCNELETKGIVTCNTEYEAADCIAYLIEHGGIKWAYEGLRIKEVPEKLEASQPTEKIVGILENLVEDIKNRKVSVTNMSVDQDYQEIYSEGMVIGYIPKLNYTISIQLKKEN